ncbi:DUF2971 domain-containing protein [Oryzomonas japonica]|uniref:DUF2971 domain-containing protein n=1 Tax=Oryzomonas japonica TaxID=2603858 RepID=A0A7J4ZNG3_9BACT|nr:DUF2971 domain-containing protein [Oryzomonas japonica]KAB0664249.1 DUF2971 domain-containing protein [Oryzomonas japonica]
MAIPEHIYKYESINAYSLKNLKAQSIYMSSPLLFNDPYDCALSTVMKEISDTDLDKLISHYVGREDVPEPVKKQFLTATKDELKDMFFRASKSAIEQNVQQFLELRGVSCFSEKMDDLLMWAHYGGCYRGFCLEFRTDSEMFNKLRQIHYSSDIPRVDVATCLIENDFDHIADLYCTKSINWQYEREWRLIHQKAGTLYVYPSEALKAIYFGPNTDAHMMEILCLIIQGQNPQVEFWRGHLSKSEFKVEFEKVDYMPHVVAKELGLV